MKVRIIKGSGDKIETTQEVPSINLLLPALFSQVDVFVQNRLVSSSTGNYSYKAMLQTLLKYGKSSKQTQFTSQLWYDDTPGFMDDCNVQNGRNIELYQSYTFFEGGKSVDLQGNICHPLFSMDRGTRERGNYLNITYDRIHQFSEAVSKLVQNQRRTTHNICNHVVR